MKHQVQCSLQSYTSVCLCVIEQVDIYTCVCVRVYISIYMYAHTHVCVCVCLSVCARACVRVCARAHAVNIHLGTFSPSPTDDVVPLKTDPLYAVLVWLET